MLTVLILIQSGPQFDDLFSWIVFFCVLVKYLTNKSLHDVSVI